MLRKIETIEDVKIELTRYFETMAAIPRPKLPDYAKNHLWQMAKSEQTTEDADDLAARFSPTPADIADCWYIDANFIPVVSQLEYKILSARLRERPVPWKVLEHRLGKTRQMLGIYMDKALQRLFVQMKI